MGRLRVTEKEGEINNGRREGERRKQRTRRGGEREGGEGSSRIVCLWRDVQLVEDYYLSNRRGGGEKSGGGRKRGRG